MARRRARKASAKELASIQRNIAKSDMRRIINDSLREIASGIQNAAIEITNGLVQAGPIWSGRFASSWYMEGVGAIGGPRISWSIYRYSKKDFRVTSIEKAIKSGKTTFSIVNTAPHASIAVDGEYAIYKHPSDRDPLKDPIEFGFRPMDANGSQEPSLRPDISMGYDTGSKPNAMITAEADWLVDYAKGGRLNRDLAHGFSIGFGGIKST